MWFDSHGNARRGKLLHPLPDLVTEISVNLPADGLQPLSRPLRSFASSLKVKHRTSEIRKDVNNSRFSAILVGISEEHNRAGFVCLYLFRNLWESLLPASELAFFNS